MSESKLRFALAGNPNCGKTTLFNGLTGSTAHVGNWPGVTVEQRSGTYRNKKLCLEADIIDLPGIYSLSPYTPEEVISRNYVLESKPDVVINVIDATNLERNLYMTTQILEMDVPVVIALNMMDALKENGQTIDAKGLSKKLGVPVVEISALRNNGLSELMKEAAKAAKEKRKGVSLWAGKEDLAAIKKSSEIYLEDGVENALFHAIKALEGDELEGEKNKPSYEKVIAAYPNVEEYEADSADKRYRYITSELAIFRQGAPKQEKKKLSKSDKIDKVLTNKWAAIPIMLLILFAIFHLVFGGDFLFLNAMGLDLGTYPGFITLNVGGEEYHPFEALFYDGGITGIGEILHGLAGDNETGILGLISLSIKQLLISASAPEWLISFIYDGVLNGIAAVLGFVPQILLLFLFFSILEDSGYMARIAFVLDRIFRKFGVSGRAFLPMVMGFGCAVPAMINTRTLSSDKERTKTIRVIPFFTCGAKAEFLVAIAAAVAAVMGFDAGLFTFLIYLLGVSVAICSVIVMNKTTQREQVPPFIMELPAYHRPQFKALMIHVWDKGKHFIKKAFTIIFVSTVVIWLFSNFTWNWQFIPTADEALGLSDGDSILAGLAMFIQPIFTPMGFGYNTDALRQTGWVYTVASVQGIVAKEAVTSSLEALGAVVADGGGFEDLVALSGISSAGLTAFAVFNLLTIPCFASLGAAKGELASKKDYVWTILFWICLSYVLGVLTYITFEYVWTLAITLPLLAGAIVGLCFYDRYKSKQEAKLAK